MATPNNNRTTLTWNTTIQLSLVASLLTMAFLYGKQKSDDHHRNQLLAQRLAEIEETMGKAWTQRQMHTWAEMLRSRMVRYHPDIDIPEPREVK